MQIPPPIPPASWEAEAVALAAKESGMTPAEEQYAADLLDALDGRKPWPELP